MFSNVFQLQATAAYPYGGEGREDQEIQEDDQAVRDQGRHQPHLHPAGRPR